MRGKKRNGDGIHLIQFKGKGNENESKKGPLVALS